MPLDRHLDEDSLGTDLQAMPSCYGGDSGSERQYVDQVSIHAGLIGCAALHVAEDGKHFLGRTDSANPD